MKKFVGIVVLAVFAFLSCAVVSQPVSAETHPVYQHHKRVIKRHHRKKIRHHRRVVKHHRHNDVVR